MRQSTTPSIFETFCSIRSAISWARSRFLPVMRMLIGVDLPSFMAPRIMPPASKANSSDEKIGSLANPARRMSTYSWADFSRSSPSCTLTTLSIGPELGV